MSRKKVVEIKKKFRENNMNFNFTKKTSSIKKVSKTFFAVNLTYLLRAVKIKLEVEAMRAHSSIGVCNFKASFNNFKICKAQLSILSCPGIGS